MNQTERYRTAAAILALSGGLSLGLSVPFGPAPTTPVSVRIFFWFINLTIQVAGMVLLLRKPKEKD